MYTLYHFPISCSNVVKIALEIIDIEHQVLLVDLYQGEQQTPGFLAINPMGKVTVLVDGNQVMTQGSAILLHLSQKLPDANLMPDLATTEGMTALKWFDFVSASLHSNFDKIFHAERISADSEIVKANAEELIVKQLNHIEDRLFEGKFLAGDKPSLFDYYFVVMLGWGQVLSFDLFERYPSFVHFKEKLKETGANSKSLQLL